MNKEQLEAAHAACEMGMENDSVNFPGVPFLVPIAIVGLLAFTVILFNL